MGRKDMIMIINELRKSESQALRNSGMELYLFAIKMLGLKGEVDETELNAFAKECGYRT